MTEHLLDARIGGILALGYTAHYDVPICDDADQVIVFIHHGYRPDVFNLHDGGCFFQRAVHLNGFHFRRHDLRDLHSVTPLGSV